MKRVPLIVVGAGVLTCVGMFIVATVVINALEELKTAPIGTDLKKI